VDRLKLVRCPAVKRTHLASVKSVCGPLPGCRTATAERRAGHGAALQYAAMPAHRLYRGGARRADGCSVFVNARAVAPHLPSNTRPAPGPARRCPISPAGRLRMLRAGGAGPLRHRRCPRLITARRLDTRDALGDRTCYGTLRAGPARSMHFLRVADRSCRLARRFSICSAYMRPTV